MHTDLKHLVTWCLVSVVNHVIPVVWGGRPKTEHMTEDPDNSEQTLCLDLKVTGQTNGDRMRTRFA